MMYEYIPNTINMKVLEDKKISYGLFLEIQIFYKNSFENLLKKIYNFSNINSILGDFPILESNSNFYREFSILDNKYLFLRNNIHLERLNERDINTIKTFLINNEFLTDEFLLKTFPQVLFEEGDISCFGENPIDDNFALSKSIVFEFAYDSKKCSINDEKIISTNYEKIIKDIKNILFKYFKCEICFVIDNGYNKNILKETKE